MRPPSFQPGTTLGGQGMYIASYIASYVANYNIIQNAVFMISDNIFTVRISYSLSLQTLSLSLYICVVNDNSLF